VATAKHHVSGGGRSGTAATLAVLVVAVLATAGCGGPKPRSEKSFDEIRKLIEDKTAQDVVGLLGDPDTRQEVFDSDERWIWWNFTFLAGNGYPPELRGRVVHLEIVFRNPSRRFEKRRPYSEWNVADDFGVSFELASRDP